MNKKSMLFTVSVLAALSSSTLVHADEATTEMTVSTPESSVIATEATATESPSSSTSSAKVATVLGLKYSGNMDGVEMVSIFTNMGVVPVSTDRIVLTRNADGSYTIGDSILSADAVDSALLDKVKIIDGLSSSTESSQSQSSEEITTSSNETNPSEGNKADTSTSTSSTQDSANREVTEVSRVGNDSVYTYGTYTIYHKSVYTGGPGVTNETWTLVDSNGDIIAIHEYPGENPFFHEAWIKATVAKYEAGEITAVGKVEETPEFQTSNVDTPSDKVSQSTSTKEYQKPIQATATNETDKTSLPKTGERSSILVYVMAIMMLVLSFLGFKKKTEK